MIFTPTKIPDVIKITPKVFKDSRGYFFEAYNQDIFTNAGIPTIFVQDNQSYSQKGTLRGLHYQHAPHGQAKLIRALSGTIYDVAVDIRKDSPTYGHWVGEILTAEDQTMLYIPEGFAHGFYVMSDTATILYKCSSLYAPQSEGSVKWNDPTLGIEWPLEGLTPMLSAKDEVAPLFRSL